MNLTESIRLIRDIRIAKDDPITPVGAAKSLEKYFNGNVLCTIGKPLSDGQFAIYAHAPKKCLPKIWNGYPVVSTIDEK